jgi:hypothetical protein
LQRQCIHLQNRLATEQQKRAAIEKEYRRLKAEFQKLKDSTKQSSSGRWRNPLRIPRSRAPKRSLLEDIEEDPERESGGNLDEPSDGASSAPAPFKSLSSLQSSGKESWQRESLNCMQYSHILMIVVAGFLVYFFVWFLILLLGSRPILQPAFTLRPALLGGSLGGDHFSIHVAMSMPGSFSYVVFPEQQRQYLEEHGALKALQVANLVEDSEASRLAQVWF